MTGTFQRSRNIDKWKVERRYQSIDSFMEMSIDDGLHTIEWGGRLLDILIRNNHSETTIVVFHGALSPRQRTIPYLEGDGIAAATGANLIACSDVSLDRGPIACGWFLGDQQTGIFKDLLSPLIRRTLDQLGSERTILFGGSGGGYAAVNFASEFPGSIVVAMNPRLNLDGRPQSTINQYLKVCHGVTTKTPMRRIKSEFMTVNLANALNDSQKFDLLLVQNMNDTRFLNHQVKPFIGELQNRDRAWVLLFDGEMGHSPLPRDEVARLISSIMALQLPGHEGYLSLGFEPAGAVL